MKKYLIALALILSTGAMYGVDMSFNGDEQEIKHLSKATQNKIKIQHQITQSAARDLNHDYKAFYKASMKEMKKLQAKMKKSKDDKALVTEYLTLRNKIKQSYLDKEQQLLELQENNYSEIKKILSDED